MKAKNGNKHVLSPYLREEGLADGVELLEVLRGGAVGGRGGRDGGCGVRLLVGGDREALARGGRP